jgi:hypothetical protein
MPKDQTKKLKDVQKASVTGEGTKVPTILLIARSADEAPPWWSPYRDVYLREFFPTESYLAGAIYSVVARNASYSVVFKGPERGVREAYQLLHTANMFHGWMDFSQLVSLDLYTQDNFGFFEVIRPARVAVKGLSGEPRAVKMMHDGNAVWAAVGRKGGKVEYVPLVGIEYELKDNPNDLPIGINHLDAARCERTADPEYPVVYYDDVNVPHKMKWYQVMSVKDMPSAQRDKNRVGYCAVTRALRLAQTLRDMTVLKQEKASGRFAGQIHLTNVDADVIQDAVEAATEHADNRGLTRYMLPIVAYTMEPNATPAVASINMASLPEGFNEEETMRWYIAGLAMALGVDYGFLAPLPGNKLGTSQQAEVAERQSRGKASRLYMEQMLEIFNYKGLLPRSVWMEFEETDRTEEMQRDMAAARRAQSRSERINSGEITPQVARQIAVDEGDLDPAYLEMMNEQDVTPGGRWKPEVAGGMNPSLGYGKVPENLALDTGQEPTEEKQWSGANVR